MGHEAWKSVKHHHTDQKHQISARRFLRKTFPRVKCHRVVSVCVVQERQRVSMTHKYTHAHTRTNAGGLCGGDFNRHVQIAAAIRLICATSAHQSSCSALGNTHRHTQTRRTHMQRTDPSGLAGYIRSTGCHMRRCMQTRSRAVTPEHGSGGVHCNHSGVMQVAPGIRGGGSLLIMCTPTWKQ